MEEDSQALEKSIGQIGYTYNLFMTQFRKLAG